MSRGSLSGKVRRGARAGDHARPPRAISESITLNARIILVTTLSFSGVTFWISTSSRPRSAWDEELSCVGLQHAVKS
eukprot:1778105-Rhodomonas_salina.1